MVSVSYTIDNGRDMQQIITTHLEASKIGQQVADQAMDLQRRIDDLSPGIISYNYLLY